MYDGLTLPPNVGNVELHLFSLNIIFCLNCVWLNLTKLYYLLVVSNLEVRYCFNITTQLELDIALVSLEAQYRVLDHNIEQQYVALKITFFCMKCHIHIGQGQV